MCAPTYGEVRLIVINVLSGDDEALVRQSNPEHLVHADLQRIRGAHQHDVAQVKLSVVVEYRPVYVL